LRYEAVKSIPASVPAATVVHQGSFAADAIRRYRQYATVLCETVSSYTLSHHLLTVNDTTSYAMCAELRLKSDYSPRRRCTRIGCTGEPPRLSQAWHPLKLTVIKNPVAEHAIKELHGYRSLQLSPDGGPVSTVPLALSTAILFRRE